MIRNFKPRQPVEKISYDLVFEYDDSGAGFAFPCDRFGQILTDQITPQALENYHKCMANPERFQYSNKIRKRTSRYTEPGEGDCICGQHVILEDHYMGACKCPGCDRWYNLFGQNLIPPEHWEEGY